MTDLICALCLYTETGNTPAVTIINGHATCEEHMPFAGITEFAGAVSLINREKS